MAKFLDKKEQVYDIKLTSYGRYTLSIGTFKPTYYAFFDDNILYDSRYARIGTLEGGLSGGEEPQNNVNKRIKQETPYLESLVLFRDVGKQAAVDEGEVLNVLDVNITPTKMTPDADVFKFNSMIGDAYLDGESNDAVPAWRVLMLQSNISSSFYRTSPTFERADAPGALVNSVVPQINIEAMYTLKVEDAEFDYDAEDTRDLLDESVAFADNKVIRLQMEDPLVYFDEVNTQLLTENFELEVFEVLSGTLNGYYNPTLQRRYFEKKIPQIENGFMVSETPIENEVQNLTTASVEYYFDVLKDSSVDQVAACRNFETFNKKGYYITFDFDCETEAGESVFYDIYGSVTEPEICQV
tara:strand:+ start:526 stop:1590 length:1065 start_codon:yes stop_codon:yes gene_type:complete